MPTLSDPDILTSFELLKREAKNEADIAAWFMQNPETLDPVNGDAIESVVVDLVYPNALLSVFFEGDPDEVQKMILLVIRKVNKPEPSALLQALSAQSKDVSPVTEQWSVPAPLREWSFMVARMAEEYVVREYWSDLYRGSQQATEYLDNVLPIHFPGWTTQSMRDLDQAGLLPTDTHGDVLTQLFASRALGNAKPALPPDFDM